MKLRLTVVTEFELDKSAYSIQPESDAVLLQLEKDSLNELGPMRYPDSLIGIYKQEATLEEVK